MITTEEAGKRGGSKTLKKYGKAHFKRISKLGLASKKAKKAPDKKWLEEIATVHD